MGDPLLIFNYNIDTLPSADSKMLNQVFLINSKSISPLKLMISHYEIMGPTSPRVVLKGL